MLSYPEQKRGARSWRVPVDPEREPAVLGEPSAAIHGEIMGREARWTCVDYLDWCCRKLHAAGKEALLLIWDNAAWHVSHQVRDWIRDHNRQVKQQGEGVRIIACYLPIKSPWLNAIEAKWVHGKRRVSEADRLLTISELADRVCDAYGCPHEPHLTIPEKVA